MNDELAKGAADDNVRTIVRLVRRSERRSDHDAPWRGFLIVPLFLFAVGLTMSTAQAPAWSWRRCSPFPRP